MSDFIGKYMVPISIFEIQERVHRLASHLLGSSCQGAGRRVWESLDMLTCTVPLKFYESGHNPLQQVLCK